MVDGGKGAGEYGGASKGQNDDVQGNSKERATVW